MAIISENNISGREVALILRAKPVQRPVEGVMMRTHDLWDLCNNDNINPFCRNRPGKSVDLTTCFNVIETRDYKEAINGECSIVKPNLSYQGAKLAEFGGYNDECEFPIRTFMPNKLVKQGMNEFYFQYMNYSAFRPENFNFNDIYGSKVGGKKIYNIVHIKNLRNGYERVWSSISVIEDGSVANKVDVNLYYMPDINAGDTLEVSLLLTDNPSAFNSGDAATYFSINWAKYGYSNKKTYIVEAGGAVTDPLIDNIRIFVQNPSLQIEQFSCGAIEICSTFNKDVYATYSFSIDIMDNSGNLMISYSVTERGTADLKANQGNRVKVINSFDIFSVPPPYNTTNNIYFTIKDWGSGRVWKRVKMSEVTWN